MSVPVLTWRRWAGRPQVAALQDLYAAATAQVLTWFFGSFSSSSLSLLE